MSSVAMTHRRFVAMAPSRSRWLAVTGMAAGLVVVYTAAVRTAAGQRLDNLSMHAAVELPRWITWPSLMALRTTIPVALVTLGIIAALAIRPGGPGLRRPLALAAGSVAAAELLKLVILPRPDLLGVEPWLAKPAFPSGHLTLALSLGAALSLVTEGRGRRLATSATWLAGSAMSAALLATHNHRVSELIGSCLVVGIAAALVGRADETAANISPMECNIFRG